LEVTPKCRVGDLNKASRALAQRPTLELGSTEFRDNRIGVAAGGSDHAFVETCHDA
jgi:hypothetical protein